MKITAKLLSQIGACQTEKFVETFPSGEVKNTKKNIRRAFAAGMDVNWLAEKILCASALAKYKEVSASALAKYKEVSAPALAKYKEVHAPAWAKYEEVRNASALAKYEEVRAPAWAKYEEVRNASLVEFLSDDDNIKKEFCAD